MDTMIPTRWYFGKGKTINRDQWELSVLRPGWSGTQYLEKGSPNLHSVLSVQFDVDLKLLKNKTNFCG